MKYVVWLHWQHNTTQGSSIKENTKSTSLGAIRMDNCTSLSIQLRSGTHTCEPRGSANWWTLLGFELETSFPFKNDVILSMNWVLVIARKRPFPLSTSRKAGKDDKSRPAAYSQGLPAICVDHHSAEVETMETGIVHSCIHRRKCQGPRDVVWLSLRHVSLVHSRSCQSNRKWLSLHLPWYFLCHHTHNEITIFSTNCVLLTGVIQSSRLKIDSNVLTLLNS